MKKLYLILFVAAILLVWAFFQYFYVTNYPILKTLSVHLGDQKLPFDGRGTVCFTQKELRDAVQGTDLMKQPDVSALTLDGSGECVCVLLNYTVKRAFSRNGFSVIETEQGRTNCVTFTVIQWKERSACPLVFVSEKS